MTEMARSLGTVHTHTHTHTHTQVILDNKKIFYMQAYSSRCNFVMSKNYARDG